MLDKFLISNIQTGLWNWQKYNPIAKWANNSKISKEANLGAGEFYTHQTNMNLSSIILLPG